MVVKIIRRPALINEAVKRCSLRRLSRPYWLPSISPTEQTIPLVLLPFIHPTSNSRFIDRHLRSHIGVWLQLSFVSTMATSSTSDPSRDFNAKTQQSPLARERAKAEANNPTQATRANRFSQYFPLGYKDGFSQWVRVHQGSFAAQCSSVLTPVRLDSGQMFRPQRRSTPSCPSCPFCNEPLLMPKPDPFRRQRRSR